MKKLLIYLFVLALAVSGCSNQMVPDKNSNSVGPEAGASATGIQFDKPLTLDDVRLAFEQADLTLIENKESKPADYGINTVIPTIFSFKDRKQVLYVYVFADIAERIEVVWQGGNLTNYSPPAFVKVPEGYLSDTFTVRNVLIVDLLDVRNASSIPPDEIQVTKAIRNIVNSLNNSQTMIFAAQSQNWDAQYVIEYYQHWYEDGAGVAHIDLYSLGKWSVKYIGPNPESIRSIKHSYKTPTGGGNGYSVVQKDGDYYYLILGENGSQGYPISNGVYTLTITWDGKEETLDLKPILN